MRAATVSSGKNEVRDPRGVFPCARCGSEFARESYLALHLGRAHPRGLAGAERAAFEAALAEEEAWLERFRRHVKASFVALPFAVTYLLVLLMMQVSGLGGAWGLLLLPVVAAFTTMLYYLTFTKDAPSEP